MKSCKFHCSFSCHFDSGLINGAADPNGNAYKFMLWAGDGSSAGGAATLHIRIWWEDVAEEHNVYDNGAPYTKRLHDSAIQ